MKDINVYRTVRFYWRCPACRQEHDWVDEGQMDTGAAIVICKCCLSKFKGILVHN